MIININTIMETYAEWYKREYKHDVKAKLAELIGDSIYDMTDEELYSFLDKILNEINYLFITTKGLRIILEVV